MLHCDRRSWRMVSFTLLLVLAPLAVPLVASSSPAANASGGSAAVVAKRGDRSAQVTQLQKLLIAAGITVKGGADGIFGAATEAAVKDYQGRRGLTVNGMADTPTATLLGMLPATPLLSKGAHSAAVTAVQRQLIAVGVTVKGGADGWYGSGTSAAVSEFQRANGIRATGNLDAATAAILANAAARAGAATTTAATTPATVPATTLPATTVPATTVPATTVPANGSIIFPMPKTCRFWDTWGAPRSGGRKHQGVDIMANSGTPLFAVQTGTITKKQVDYPGSLAGNALWLTMADGTYYFYAHLSAFANGVGVGSKVSVGAVIGYVGKTGNASIPHLHFEVHPRGGSAVNPYPIVKAVSGC